MYNATSRASSKPGSMPAANRLPTDTPVVRQKMIMATLGGIKTPKPPPALMAPSTMCLS